MRERIKSPSLALVSLLLFSGCASSGPKPTNLDIDAMAERISDQILRSMATGGCRDFCPEPHDNSVLWQISAEILRNNNLTGIRLVSPDRILITIKNSNPLLINADNGAVVWEQRTWQGEERELGAKGKPDFNKYFSAAYVTVHRDTVIFRADGDSGSKILAVETTTGNTRWAVELKKAGALALYPLPATETLVAVQQDKNRATLSAFNLSNGAANWKRDTGYGSGTVDPPDPTVDDAAIFTFYNGVERLSAASGKTEWRRPEILAGRQSPPMQVNKEHLIILDGKNVLQFLNARTGATMASRMQRDGVAYTNIFPLGDRVYLRGVRKDKSGDPQFLVTAVRSADGKELWADTDRDPSVSNLIDENGRLFFSTPFTVVALDRNSGVRKFTVKASDLGKSFPVRIRSYGDRVVYVGELVVAAFDAKTGARIYRHGFTPVHQTAHMDALNEAIESTAKSLSWFTGPLSGWDLSGANMSNFFFQQASYSQNQSNYEMQRSLKYSFEASTASSGSTKQWASMKRDIHLNNAKIDAAFSSAQFSIGMAAMTVANIQKAAEQLTATDRARLRKLLEIRELLYAAHVATQWGDYAYRPTKESGAVGISVIHLQSGRASYTELTPEYNEFGVFSLVDIEKGIVYHPRIGKKPGMEGFFMARPVKIPK